MKTLSSLTDSGDSSRTDSPDSRDGADAESPASEACSKAGALTRAGLSALGTGLLALARGTGALARGGLVTGEFLGRGAVTLGRGMVVMGRGVAAAGRGTLRLARVAGAPVRRWRIPERSGRAVLAVAAASALAGVRVWLLCRVLLTSRGPRTARPPRTARGSRSVGSPRASQSSRTLRTPEPSQPPRLPRPTRRSRPPVRLTARGGIVIMFGACFLGLLLADWVDWTELAYAVFFMASSLTAYYTRPGSLLPVSVSPPLLFFAAMTAEKFVFAAGLIAAVEGTLVMLASAATWLFAGTALTLTIALLRGLPHEIRALVLDLRG